MRPIPVTISLCAALALAACNQEERPGEVEVYDEIGPDEVISLMGTEPFWSMEIKQGVLLYTTPELLDGVDTTVTRFEGNSGLGLSGELQGEPLQIAITPGECSDAMSDRTYPFTATVTIGEKQLNGCGYTDVQPFEGDPMP